MKAEWFDDRPYRPIPIPPDLNLDIHVDDSWEKIEEQIESDWKKLDESIKRQWDELDANIRKREKKEKLFWFLFGIIIAVVII